VNLRRWDLKEIEFLVQGRNSKKEKKDLWEF
jgi:hypothetical protein